MIRQHLLAAALAGAMGLGCAVPAAQAGDGFDSSGVLIFRFGDPYVSGPFLYRGYYYHDRDFGRPFHRHHWHRRWDHDRWGHDRWGHNRWGHNRWQHDNFRDGHHQFHGHSYGRARFR